MLMVSDLFVVFLVSLIFFVRVYPLLNKKKVIGSDEAYHIYHIELIRKHKHITPLRDSSLLGGSNDIIYPLFYHKILSYISPKFLKYFFPYSSLAYDTLTISFIGFFLHSKGLSFDAIIVNTTLFLIFSAFIFQSIGPRSYTLTPRNFSQFVCALGGICLIAYYEHENIWFVQGAAILFAIAMISSKFSRQYIIGVSVGMSLINLSFMPALFLLNVVLWALLFQGRIFLESVIGQGKHLNWYMKEGLSFINPLWSWKKIFQKFVELDLKNLFSLLVFHNPLTKGIILNLPLFLILARTEIPLEYESLVFSFQVVLMSVGIFFLTQFWKFRVFGEPGRYLEFSIPFFIFFNASYNTIEFSLICLAYSCVWNFYSLYIRCKTKDSEDALYDDIKEIKDCLIQKDKEKTILCTANNEAYMFIGPCDKFISGFPNKKGFTENLYSPYPHVNPKILRDLYHQHKISHLIIKKNTPYENDYDTSFAQLIKENKFYKLFKANA